MFLQEQYLFRGGIGGVGWLRVFSVSVSDRTRESISLGIAGAFDAAADIAGAFAGPALQQLIFGKARDFNLDIDAVQQRAGDALLVLLHLCASASALAEHVSEVYSLIATEIRLHPLISNEEAAERATIAERSRAMNL